MRNNGARARRIVILLWIMFGLEIIVVLSSYLEYDTCARFLKGEAITDTAWEQNDLRQQVVFGAYLLARLLSVIFFIQWFRRAYYNLHTLHAGLLQKEGWAAAAWFVPVMNLYVPFQIMRELYERSIKFINERSTQLPITINESIVGVWWFFWIFTNIMSNVLFRSSMSTTTMEEFVVDAQLQMLQGVFAIPLALLAIKVVRDYAGLEQRQYALALEDRNAGTTPSNLGADILDTDLDFD